MGNNNSSSDEEQQLDTSEGLVVDRLYKLITGVYNENTSDSPYEKLNKSIDAINNSMKLQHQQTQTLTSIDTFYQIANVNQTKTIIPSTLMNSIGLNEFTTEDYKILYDPRRFHEIYNLIPDVTNTLQLHQNQQFVHKRFSSQQSYKSIYNVGGYEIGNRIGNGTFGVVHEIKNYNDRVVKIIHGDIPEQAVDVFLETIIQLILFDECSVLNFLTYAKIGRLYNLFRFTINSHTYIAIVMEPFHTNVANYFQHISQNIRQNQKSVIELSTANIFMLYQTFRTLMYLSKKLKFSHRDLKCDNIMINFIIPKNSNGFDCFQTFLIDFGSSRLEYNGFLFSSNYMYYFDDINKDFHNPIQDVGFLIFQTLWFDGCEQYALKRCGVLEPIFYSRLVNFILSLSPKIKKDYITKGYIGVNEKNEQNWWKLYVDLIYSNYGFSNNNSTFDYSVIHTILIDLKTLLRKYARNQNAQEPFYFGTRR